MGRKRTGPATPEKRRRFDDEFKQNAVQMLVDGHAAAEVAERLGLSGANLLYRWKKELLGRSGQVAASLEERVRGLEAELQRVERERDILKNSLGHLEPQRVADLHPIVERLAREEDLPVRTVCEVLGISRSAHYAWRQHVETPRAARDRELEPLVRDIFHEHKRRYGSRRIVAELADRDEVCGRARVAKLLRNQGLRAIQPKSRRPRTTDSRHALGYSPNLLLDHDGPTRPDEIWVADITYIPLKEKRFGYLSLLMDLFSRRVVGWHFDLEMTEPLVLTALRHAIGRRQPPIGLIHHSDRGGQYAGGRYRETLARGEVRQSMSRAANCYDNAFMESCFGTIKTELEMTEYEHDGHARDELTRYLAYYDVQRRHSALDYLTPLEFERRHGIEK